MCPVLSDRAHVSQWNGAVRLVVRRATTASHQPKSFKLHDTRVLPALGVVCKYYAVLNIIVLITCTGTCTCSANFLGIGVAMEINFKVSWIARWTCKHVTCVHNVITKVAYTTTMASGMSYRHLLGLVIGFVNLKRMAINRKIRAMSLALNIPHSLTI